MNKSTSTLAGVLLIVAAMWPARSFAFSVFVNTAAQQPYRWNLEKLPDGLIYWHVEEGSPAILREAMLDATARWTASTGGQLKFAEGPGGIFVEWDETGSTSSDDLVLAFASFRTYSSPDIVNAGITVNAWHYTWHRGGPFGVTHSADGRAHADLDGVILHELGHALGLDHSDKNSAAIVGAWSPGNAPTMNSIVYPGAETLHSDDMAGAQHLYGLGGETPAPEAEPAASPLSIAASSLTGYAPLRVTLKNASADPATTWDFGDGTSGSGAAARHRFSAPGTYTVTARSGQSSATLQIEVQKKARKSRRS